MRIGRWVLRFSVGLVCNILTIFYAILTVINFVFDAIYNVISRIPRAFGLFLVVLDVSLIVAMLWSPENSGHVDGNDILSAVVLVIMSFPIYKVFDLVGLLLCYLTAFIQHVTCITEWVDTIANTENRIFNKYMELSADTDSKGRGALALYIFLSWIVKIIKWPLFICVPAGMGALTGRFLYWLSFIDSAPPASYTLEWWFCWILVMAGAVFGVYIGTGISQTLLEFTAERTNETMKENDT